MWGVRVGRFVGVSPDLMAGVVRWGKVIYTTRRRWSSSVGRRRQQRSLYHIGVFYGSWEMLWTEGEVPRLHGEILRVQWLGTADTGGCRRIFGVCRAVSRISPPAFPGCTTSRGGCPVSRPAERFKERIALFVESVCGGRGAVGRPETRVLGVGGGGVRVLGIWTIPGNPTSTTSSRSCG